MKIFIALILTLVCQGRLYAQSAETKFQDVFITAGYATAFGAALGAASLSFVDRPQDHLQYVAVGASLGFISGSVLGTYLVLSPIAMEKAPGPTDLAGTNPEALTIRPVFSGSRLMQIETMATLVRF